MATTGIAVLAAFMLAADGQGPVLLLAGRSLIAVVLFLPLAWWLHTRRRGWSFAP